MATIYPVFLSGSPADLVEMDPGAGHTLPSAGMPADVVKTSGAQTLADKSLDKPTIADLRNAQHDHRSTVGGGALAPDAMSPAAAHVLSASLADTAAIANTVVETAFASTYALLAGQFAVGRIVRVLAVGTYGTDAAAPTLRLRVKADATTLLDLGAQMLVGGVAGKRWLVEVDLLCRTAGAAGTILVVPRASVLDLVSVPLAAASVVLDTTAGHTLQVTAEWGTANANNTALMQALVVDRAS